MECIKKRENRLMKVHLKMFHVIRGWSAIKGMRSVTKFYTKSNALLMSDTPPQTKTNRLVVSWHLLKFPHYDKCLEFSFHACETYPRSFRASSIEDSCWAPNRVLCLKIFWIQNSFNMISKTTLSHLKEW